MKNFLTNRTAYLIGDTISEEYIDIFNTDDYINVFLRRLDSITQDISNSIEFLDAEYPEIENSINNLMDSLEFKLVAISDSARFMSRVKNEFSNMSDVSVINFSDGKLEGLDYSTVDSGLILSTSSMIYING